MKSEAQTCTCHPSEAPIPCPHKYAYSECVAAARAAADAEMAKLPRHVPIFVTYDDIKNDIPNIQGNVTNLEAFCKAIEQGRIGNVRVDKQ
jgi:hypothetical protein